MTNDGEAWARQRRRDQEDLEKRRARKVELLPAARDKVATLVEALRDAHGDKTNEVEMKVWKAVIQQARNVR